MTSQESKIADLIAASLRTNATIPLLTQIVNRKQAFAGIVETN